MYRYIYPEIYVYVYLCIMCNDKVIWNWKKALFKTYIHLHSEPCLSEKKKISLFIKNGVMKTLG